MARGSELLELLKGLKRPHTESPMGDPYEQCPVTTWENIRARTGKPPRSWPTRPECECGADEHNRRVDDLVSQLSECLAAWGQGSQ